MSVRLVVPALALLLAGQAEAQVASALLVEGGPLPGAPGVTITFLNNPAVNRAGGYAVTVNGSDGVDTLSHVWGSATGGAGSVLAVESTFGAFTQTSFESNFGLADSGAVAYSAIGSDSASGSTGLDSAWVDGTPVAVEETPVVSLPGQFWVFASRVTITADGTPLWIGGYGPTQGGSTQARGLFSGAGATPLLKTGDLVPNLPFALDTSNTVAFDYGVSALGSRVIAEVQMDTTSTVDNAMVLDGAGLLLGGTLVREGNAVPASVGGLVGEAWDNFDLAGVTEAGAWFFTGDTDASTDVDEIIVRDGAVFAREGDVLGGEVLANSISGASINEDGDLAFLWQIETPGGDVEALYFEDRLLLQEGDPCDLDGDGTNDATFVEFTGIGAFRLGDRDADGNVTMYFTGDADGGGGVVEGFFELTVSATFADLGCELAGSAGAPELSGEGSLESGSSNALTLSNAAPNAASLLFASLASTPVPFKGGTLKTVPVLTTIGLTTPPSGTVTLPFTWPAGVPSDLDVFFQWAIQDGGAPVGVALSNALRATTP